MGTEYFSLQRLWSALPKVIAYLPTTLLLVVVSIAIGTVLGLLLAFIRIRRIPVADQIATVLISFVRGTPEIVLLFIVFYGLPLLVADLFGIDINGIDPFVFAVIALGLNQAAFLAELFRGALESVPAGQYEAGYAAGLTGVQTFFRIIIPQAIRAVLPSFSLMFVGLFQTTVLASAIGVMDVMGRADAIGTATSHALEPLTAAAIVFIVISTVMEWLFRRLNARVAFGR